MSASPRIESLEAAIRRRAHEVTEAVIEELRWSVRPVIVSKEGRNPKIVGTCTLLDVDERKYVITAAHVLDSLDSHAVYVSGTVGTEPTQILGLTHLTKMPPGGRNQDKLDIAFWEIDTHSIQKLGNVSFIDASRVSCNLAPTENRLYLAMGYAASRNKRNVNNPERTIKLSLSQYTGELDVNPVNSSEFGVSGDRHLFLKYPKYSETRAGEKRRAFEPVGLSGGPLIDLGNFGQPERYQQEPSGHISGMIIERMRKQKLLVAVKIQVVVDAIRQQAAP